MPSITNETKKCPTPYGKTLDGYNIACKRWSCPHCANVKIMEISNKVAKGYENRINLYRITITQRQGSKRNIMKDWRLVRKRIERHLGCKISYFWVKERQQNGQRHLHLLIDHGIDWRWLKNNYAEVTKGESFHIYVSEKPVLHSWGYAMKYLTKDLDTQTIEIETENGKEIIPYFDYKERKYGFSSDFRGISGCREDFIQYKAKS